MQQLIKHIQVNIPFTMLHDKYISVFLRHAINPEIGIDAQALERFSFSEFSSVAERLREHPLTITLHGPFIDLSPGSTDPAVGALTKHRFEQVLKLVPLFKPKAVVFHAGYEEKRYGYMKEKWIENSVQLWSWLGARMGDEGALMMLENVYENGPEDIQVVFESLGQQNIGFCLDTGHLSAFGQAPLDKWLVSLGSYLGQIHLHDNHGNKDEHLALGRGNIDFQLLFRYLKTRKHKPPIVTLEPHQEEDFLPSLKYMEKNWPW